MSSTEIHTGQIRIIKNIGGEEWAINYINDLTLKGKKFSYDDIIENFNYDLEGKVLIDGEEKRYYLWRDMLFEIINHIEKRDYDDISSLVELDNGDYQFLFQFYNGGTCFEEMLEESFQEKLDKV